MHYLVGNTAVANVLIEQLLQNNQQITTKIWQPKPFFNHLWLRKLFVEQSANRLICPNLLHQRIAKLCLHQLSRQQQFAYLQQLNFDQLAPELIRAAQLMKQYLAPLSSLSNWDDASTLVQQWSQLCDKKMQQLGYCSFEDSLIELVNNAELIRSDQPLKAYRVEHILTPLQKQIIAKVFPNHQYLDLVKKSNQTQAYIANNPIEEIESALLWAQQQQRSENTQPSKITVVIPNLTQIRSLVKQRIRRLVVHCDFHIAGAEPLHNNPSIASMLQLIRLGAWPKSYHSLFAITQLSLWQQCGLVSASQAQHIILKQNRYFYSTEQLILLVAKLFKPNIADIVCDFLNSTATQSKQLLSATQWWQLCLQYLNALHWQFKPQNDQQVKYWQTLEFEMQQLEQTANKLKFAEWLQLLVQFCSVQITHGLSKDKINIIDTVDGAVGFDYVWLCSASSEQWPKPQKPHPLLPLAVQKQYKMPNVDSQVQFGLANQLLQSLKNQTPLLVASYDSETSVAIASAFKNQPKLDVDCNPVKQPVAKIVAFQDKPPPPITDTELATIKQNSALIKQLCNSLFTSFIQYRLFAEPLQFPTIGMQALDRGNLIHNSLELFHRHYIDVFEKHGQLYRIQALPDDWQQTLSDFVTQVCNQNKTKVHFLAGQLDNEITLINNLCARAIQNEMQQPEQFEPTFVEQKSELNIASLSIKLKIDRIDRAINSNQLRIIDYKTGSDLPDKTSVKGDGKNGLTEPQMALYALSQISSENIVVQLVYSQINPKELQWEVITEYDELQSLLPIWEQTIVDVITEFKAGVITFGDIANPKQKDNTYQQIARIDFHPEHCHE